MRWFARSSTPTVSPASTERLEASLPAPAGGLAVLLDDAGLVRRVMGDLGDRLAPVGVTPRPLGEYLSAESALLLADCPAGWVGRMFDLEFRCCDGRLMQARGWLQRREDGWLLQALGIGDLLARAGYWEVRRHWLAEAGRMAGRLRRTIAGQLPDVVAELLQDIAQRGRMSSLALILGDGGRQQLYAQYRAPGVAQLWPLSRAVARRLEEVVDSPQLLPTELPDFLGGAIWAVPYRENAGQRAWLITAPYDPQRQLPELGPDDWLQLCAQLAGPLLARLAEQQGRREQARLQALQEMLGTGWWAFHPGERRFQVAPVLARNWRLASTEVDLEDWLAALHPADRDEFRVRLLALESAGQGFVQCLRLDVPADDACWQRVQAMVLEEGRQRRIVGFALDISEIQQEKAQAEAARDRLRNVVASAPAIIYVQRYVEGALALEFCSDSLQQLLGWSLEELRDGQLAGRLHPDDLDGYFVATRRLLREGVISHRYRLRDRCGDYHWMLDEARLLRDELGLPREVVGLWLDVTEATLAAERVRASEERYRILVEDSPAMICRYRPDLTLSFANRPLADYLECSPQALVGTSLAEWMSDEQRQAFRERLMGLSPENPLSTAEICLQLPGHDHAWWIWADRGVFDEHGRLLEVQAVGRDNTEVRKAQQQLYQGAKMATLGEMATGMAHEMNQPLNVMRMAVANVLRRLASGEVAAEYLQDKLMRIEAQIQRAARIVDHMRVFGRRSEVERQLFDPLQAVEGALSLLADGLRNKGVELRLNLPAQTAQVRGYADQLEQVLINLMVNARDALLGRQAEAPEFAPWITLSARVEGEWVRLFVEDNGGGIDPRLLARIFEPFFTTKPVGKGTGLGLSVSYGIVQQMGGQLTVENAQHGARFCIALPVERAGE